MENQTKKMKRIWDNYEVVGEVRKSDGIKFVVAAATREGFRYINIREFYYRKKDGVWKPGRDGITIPLVAGLNKGETFINPSEKMMELLHHAASEVEGMELMDERRLYGPSIRSAQSNEDQRVCCRQHD